MARSKRNILAAASESTTPPDAPLPAYHTVARVGRPEGNNLYTCHLPNTKTVVVELAQRFRNTIWIKRGGFVLLDLTPRESHERSGNSSNKAQGDIVNVVRDEKEWRKMPYWPKEFPKHTYDDDDEDMNRDMPPSESEDDQV